MTADLKQVLTEREVHTRYGLTVPWLRKRRRVGGGPNYLKLGRLIRYRVPDIDLFLAERIVPQDGAAQ